MDFWGTKVSGLKAVACPVGQNNYLHVSNAALASGTGRVVVRLKSDGEEFVLGTLEAGKCDQLSLDVILSKPFELTHNSKTATVHVTGYKTEAPSGGDEEEALEKKPVLVQKENGKISASDSSDESDSDDDDDDEEDGDTSDSESDEDLNINVAKPYLGDSSDDDDSDEDDDEDDEDEDDSDDDEEEENALVLPKKKLEEKPKTPQQGKKRSAEAVTPSSDKQTKKSRPDEMLSAKSEKSVLKTPKTPKSSEKEKDKKAKTPTSNTKSPGQYRCASCSRDFASDSALTQHNTAKHKA